MVCLMLAIFSFLGYFNMKAIFIDLFSDLLKSMLGYGFWLMPPALLLGAYILAYAPVRFALEFFRGDAVRGVFGPLSTSQWISLAAVAAVLLGRWYAKRRRQRRACDT